MPGHYTVVVFRKTSKRSSNSFILLTAFRGHRDHRALGAVQPGGATGSHPGGGSTTHRGAVSTVTAKRREQNGTIAAALAGLSENNNCIMAGHQKLKLYSLD